MRKLKRPSFDELIVRLISCIEIRNPKETISETQEEVLRNHWKQDPEKLYKFVLKLEQNEQKAISEIRKRDVRKTEFQIGVTLDGEPILCTHLVEFENLTKDPKRYKKKGSDFTQKLVLEVQIQNRLF